MYHHEENLAVYEMIMKYNETAGFRQYIPKRERLGIKLYKLCDNKEYTYDMIVYLGKQHVNTAKNDTLYT
jgi:hypothetical protein